MGIYIFDVDGTIADMHTAWVHQYNLATGDSVRVTDFKTWKVAPKMPRWTEEEHIKLISDPNFYYDVYPIPGALDVIKELRKRHTVLFVSDCYEDIFKMKLDWLGVYGFLTDRNQLIAMHGSYRYLMNCTALIDDNADTANGHRTGLLYLQPWNWYMSSVVPFIDNWQNFDESMEALNRMDREITINFF